MIELLLNPRFVAAMGGVLALGTPLTAVVMLALWETRDRPLTNRPLFWVLALSGPLIVGLWFAFSAIEDYFGLDSIPAMLVNLLLFCLVGVGISAFLKYGGPVLPQGEGGRKREAGSDPGASPPGKARPAGVSEDPRKGNKKAGPSAKN